MATKTTSRRIFLQSAGAAAAGALAAPYVKTATSAGKLKLGVLDHWVPGTNQALRQILTRWGETNGVDVSVDFITSLGNKPLLTAQAEARARAGHDIFMHSSAMVPLFKNRLVPLDDVVEDILSTQGPIADVFRYAGHLDGSWRVSPAPTGTNCYATVARRDLFLEHAAVDLTELFPANDSRDPAKVESWDWEAFRNAAGALHAAGVPVGAPVAPIPDSTGWLTQLFAAYGAAVVDERGDIAVNSDPVREVLEYAIRLLEFLPDGVYAWDDAGNNRWIISGSGSAIFNPPSAWAVAKRDSPDVARHIWHCDSPRGPAGRFRTFNTIFWGLWDFSENQSAARDLLRYVAEPDVVAAMLEASQGYDLPMVLSHYDHTNVWAEGQPPAGGLYNYAIRGDEQPIVGGYPAPAEIGASITVQRVVSNLVARVTQGGDSIDAGISWAENELAGVLRG
ncbi:MAG: extracellular solute-binding protein [Rhodospirillales bacterium]|nr:extracellular solute-binding protein [Rhodospirillales bacterium]